MEKKQNEEKYDRERKNRRGIKDKKRTEKIENKRERTEREKEWK